ncbi:MAG TPA: low affinity iron permease family protein [Actinomycetota bacterium]|nr:low affinity iron permease family protein [Actinomycetota bacterium]
MQEATRRKNRDEAVEAPAAQRRLVPRRPPISDRQSRLNVFDRWAEKTARFAGQAEFFAGSVALVVLWTLTYPLIGDFDTWQIVLSAGTSAITFLLVALLQNAQSRSERAVQCKLDALADGLAQLMERVEDGSTDLAPHIESLKSAVGLEERVSGKDVLSGEPIVGAETDPRGVPEGANRA